jgi:hypothetical protein
VVREGAIGWRIGLFLEAGQATSGARVEHNVVDEFLEARIALGRG